jgi:peptidyl-tRNA hydrolase, PTH1 family
VKIVVGLGNPGSAYEGTPHNVGFDTLDVLAARWGCAFRRGLRFAAHTAKAEHGEERVLLLKPQTFMNRSGAAVGALLRYHKATPNDMLIVLDDADLELGRIRIRPGGGSGGHKGLASVIESVGTGQFVRIRLGVGRREQEGDLVTHVLRPFRAEARSVVQEMTVRAADAVCCVLDCGVADAMNRFNAACADVPDRA